MAAAELEGHLAGVLADADPCSRTLVASLDGPGVGRSVRDGLRRHPGPTVGIGTPGSVDPGMADALDILVTADPDPPQPWVHAPDPERSAADVHEATRRQPTASRVLVDVLRIPAQDVAAGLVTEAAAYSTLLAGEEFAAWLHDRGPATHREFDRRPVAVEREVEAMRIVLDRPEVANAFDAAMREALVDALTAAALDGSTSQIELTGRGDHFCAGGDLGEFGTANPATAYIVRVTRSPGWWIHRLADRVRPHLHGACIGAGIELPAFADRVVADPGTTVRLPEVGMGLIPGAGGTVSIPRRIGRHRTAWLALTGTTLDVEDALAWGLVDAIA